MTLDLSISRRGALGLAGGAAATLAMPGIVRAAGVDLVVHYSMPAIFKDAQEAIAAAFNARQSAIRVSYVNPTPTYEDGAQLILRQAATGQLPDVSFQGLNRLRLFAERGIALDLRGLLKDEGDPARLGYSAPLLGLGFHGGSQAGLAFATSNPISYYNADLLKRVGADPEAFPKTWDDAIALSAKIAGLGDGINGMFFRWPGDDWMFSALLYGYGGRMLTTDEKAVAFNGPEGLAALKLLDRMVKEGRMPNLAASASSTQDLQAFAAGKLGMMFRTTAQVRAISQSVGANFTLRTTVMPVIDPVKGRLPTGGAGAMITAKDPNRQRAAWEFVKFATSAEGTSLMVKNTGYVPTNQIAIDNPEYLGDFYKQNPLFVAATKQVPLMIPWYAFPGQNSVRVTQVMVDQLARIAEQKATPEAVLADMATEVTKLIPTP
ncbi:ABC transporter substrate-binding protein [Prosthecomicrobium hirschii]|uniref:ABC transporter substrate-binding protein n=1 Tax=Prosthecodimorpha hirschii TaxID=665126 RepID=A0A0P6VP90_9HYPH|nr:ABC transporter substrate-binding protein [Prosthecomicrobium hirschii]KPL53048.1 ABC transporter substrate-binding protein [Prosthecomicrobium hirschii]